MGEWKEFDGDYDKKFYDVKTSDGKIIKECWPNAGNMHSTDGSGRSWTEKDNITIRKSDTDE